MSRSTCYFFNSANRDQINETVRGNRRISIWMIAETVNADTENVRKILYDELNMNKNLTLD